MGYCAIACELIEWFLFLLLLLNIKFHNYHHLYIEF